MNDKLNIVDYIKITSLEKDGRGKSYKGLPEIDDPHYLVYG
jgi:hypothetical protein